MKIHPIRFLSGFIAAIAVPVLVNAGSLSWSLLYNPTEIAKDKYSTLGGTSAKTWR